MFDFSVERLKVLPKPKVSTKEMWKIFKCIRL
jgi:hypothetical protein